MLALTLEALSGCLAVKFSACQGIDQLTDQLYENEAK